MSYLVVGKKSGSAWDVEVRGVGTTTSPDLNGVEAAARALLASEGKSDSATVDLQLLLPDFEADLSEERRTTSACCIRTGHRRWRSRTRQTRRSLR